MELWANNNKKARKLDSGDSVDFKGRRVAYRSGGSLGRVALVNKRLKLGLPALIILALL